LNYDPDLFKENERFERENPNVRFLETGPLKTEFGGHLEAVTVAYETFGQLNEAKDNAVLVCHAVSGDSNCVGWWKRLVGPGRAIDTDRYFVIGQNSLGGCSGTTGPASTAPDGNPYGSRFPLISIRDIVDVQKRLVEHLGIDQLLGVVGGSMGGMQALEWTARYPDSVKKAWVTASAAAHNAMQIGFNEAGRQAVMRDPKWRGGDYALDDPPVQGLSVARMIGHLSYLSMSAFEQKFGRRLQDKENFDRHLGTEFQVESYLSYQGDKFTRRFDPNSFLYLTRALDYYERRSLAGARAEFLFTSFSSDWLYPPEQSAAMHAMAQTAGCQSQWVNIDLPFGHDSFLLDAEGQGEVVTAFLGKK
jgi:homoserine O-acetyltransferase